MKTFVANVMSEVLEIVLWLNIVVCAIIGYKIGDSMNHNFVGAILGVLVGFVLNVLEGGIFLLLMEIRDYVKEIAEIDDTIVDYVKKIAENNQPATKIEASNTKKEDSSIKNVSIDMNSLLSH